MKKAERLNREMAWLTSHGAFTLGELAACFGVSRRTALRDVEELEGFGLALSSQDGRTGGYRVLNRGTLLPVSFSEDEVNAIFFALHALSLLTDNPFGQSYRSVCERLMATLPEARRSRVAALQDAVRHVGGESVSECPFLRELLEAAVSGRIAEAASPQLAGGKCAAQLLWIFLRGGSWFFEGVDLQSGRWIRARCDALTSLRCTARPGPYSREELKTLRRCSLQRARGTAFRCRISPSAREHYFRNRYENIRLEGDELRGSYSEGELGYMIDYVVGFAGGVTVIEPEELREGCRRKLRAMLGDYEPPPAS